MATSDLLINDQPDPDAVAQATWNSDMAQADGDERQAAALVAGLQGADSAVPVLISWLNDDDTGIVAWALGQLPSEQAVRDAVTDGAMDTRDNGYSALAHLAARDAASNDLGDWCAERVAAELAITASGKTGLAEKACKVLGVLGDPRTDELAQKVVEQDQYCDRFEMQRIRKAVRDGERDKELIDELTEDWREQFADELAPTMEAEVTGEHVDAQPSPAASDPLYAAADPENAPLPEQTREQIADEQIHEAQTAAPDAEAAADAGPAIDWEDFLASDEAQAIDEQMGQLVGQFGPMLEQLAAQAVGKPLLECSDQEFAAVYLQVMPQAIPPQYMQIMVSPQALKAFKALGSYLARVHEHHGVADGLEMVREAIKQQLRASGSLHGSDYDDEDASPLA